VRADLEGADGVGGRCRLSVTCTGCFAHARELSHTIIITIIRKAQQFWLG
jgi:hypothetical protein